MRMAPRARSNPAHYDGAVANESDGSPAAHPESLGFTASHEGLKLPL
jgi:hypothetical protein